MQLQESLLNEVVGVFAGREARPENPTQHRRVAPEQLPERGRIAAHVRSEQGFIRCRARVVHLAWVYTTGKEKIVTDRNRSAQHCIQPSANPECPGSTSEVTMRDRKTSGRTNCRILLGAILAAVAFGCDSDDDAADGEMADAEVMGGAGGGDAPMGGTGGGDAPMGGAGGGDAPMGGAGGGGDTPMGGAGGGDTPMGGAGGESDAMKFRVTIENVSGDTAIPSPFAPGAWVLHTAADPFFEIGMPDRGEGLEMLAEDGDPSTLAEKVAIRDGVTAAGAFNTPVDADGPGPLFPGSAYAFEFEASPGDGALSFATMFVQSNDVFAAPDRDGIPLFDDDDMPMGARDVTDMLALWDAGTEADERPGQGPWQAPRQTDTKGPMEGVVHRFGHTTRAVPPPTQLAAITVARDGDDFMFHVENISAEAGGMMSPLAPVFWATHDASWTLFTAGEEAPDGLEMLAEDGSPMGLVEANSGAAGTGAVGAAAVPEGADEPGPIGPGGAYAFTVTPDADHPWLTIAFMVVQSNDAFVAPAAGVALVDDEGAPRDPAHVEADLARVLAVWDAGTEANQVPGFGPDQPARQAGANTGDADPAESGVALYTDATNDLAGDDAGGLVSLTVAAGAADGELVLRYQNVGLSAFPAIVTPLLWALGDGSAPFFEMGAPATAGLEMLAEDGDPSAWHTALEAAGWTSGVLARPMGTDADGPLTTGMTYEGVITPSADQPLLSVASMVVPSNDTFASTGPDGVPLFDDDGNLRDPAAINADLTAALHAFDAGTEANQGGAMGPDMAPHQSGPNTGAAEGDGTVRMVDGQIWHYPAVTDLLRVTVEPVE